MTSILVVDDSKIDLKRASALLAKHFKASSIFIAQDGQEAMECLREERPNVVVTDLQMPRMNGLELVMEARKHFPCIPVVLMTGAGSEQIAAEALAKGAASYVPKSQLAADLPTVVGRLLGVATENRQQCRLQESLVDISFLLETDRDVLSSFVQMLREYLGTRRLFSENDSLRLLTAVDEALANAYYHGNLEVSSRLREQDASSFHQLADRRLRLAPYRDRRIFVRARFAEEFEISIRDEGPGFEPELLPDPRAAGFVDRPSGRGLLLMYSFMDRVQFNDKGNQVNMAKRTRLSAFGGGQ